MAPRIVNEQIEVEVVVPFEAERGVTIPRGIYKAEKRQTEAADLSNSSWSSPNYYLKLDAVEAGRLGVTSGPGLLGPEYRITEQVQRGDIKIRS